MTNLIASEIDSLSEEKFLKIFPGYFGAPSSSGTWRKIGDVSVFNGSGKITGGRNTDDEKFEGSSTSDDVIIPGTSPTAPLGQTVIFGATDNGNDRLTGKLGNDVLVGGKGNNVIFGGAGADYLYGDQLRIQRSSDSTAPSAMVLDTISSTGDGNDFLFGGSGDDFLHGGGGVANFLRGARDSDTVIGDANSKRDVLIGYRGPNDDDNRPDYLKSGGAPYTFMAGGGGSDVFDITATGAGDYVKILDFSNGDKIKLPPNDSIAVLYDMVINQDGVEWDWDWVATETDDGVTIPLDDGALLYLQDAAFSDLTASVSATTFEIT